MVRAESQLTQGGNIVKKLMSMLLIVSMVVLATPAFALWDTKIDEQTNNSSDATALAAQQQGQGQAQGQGQGQMQGQAAIAAQGQGQLGIVGQKATNDQSVSVGGDTQKNNAYILTAPNTVAGDGQQAMAAYSIVGGVNVAESSEYKVCIEKIRIVSQMLAADLITKDVAIVEANAAFEQMKDSTQPKRILWVGPKTRGIHLGNGLGLLAMDGCSVNTDTIGKKKSK
jgi:hypothetical protein